MNETTKHRNPHGATERPHFLEMSKRRVISSFQAASEKKNDGLNQGGTTSLWPDHPSVQTEQLINPGDALRPKGRPACIEAGATEISGFLFV